MNDPRQSDIDDVLELLKKADSVLTDPDDITIEYEDPAADSDAPIQNYANGYGAAPQSFVPPIHAYNADYRPQRQTRQDDATQVIPTPRMPRQPVRPVPPAPAPEPEYIPETPAKKPKRRHGCLTRLIIFALIVFAVFTAVKLWIAPPKAADDRSRISDTATILLCGTDADGTRTDTMMLLYINGSDHKLGLLSLPRDSLTRTAYGDRVKLNSAYGRNGCGEEGMEVLLDYVARIIGYRPDGYMLVDFTQLAKTVDEMGGVDFDVPQDMHYEDPTQDLFIDLKKGMQHLSGSEAVQLLRFRSGYASADLARVQVQRAFIQACMEQWLKPSRAKDLWNAAVSVQADSLTNLSTRNYLWIGMEVLRCGIGSLKTDTLPGHADMIDGVSYYVLHAQEICDLVNESFNPFRVEITQDDLTISR